MTHLNNILIIKAKNGFALPGAVKEQKQNNHLTGERLVGFETELGKLRGEPGKIKAVVFLPHRVKKLRSPLTDVHDIDLKDSKFNRLEGAGLDATVRGLSKLLGDDR